MIYRISDNYSPIDEFLNEFSKIDELANSNINISYQEISECFNIDENSYYSDSILNEGFGEDIKDKFDAFLKKIDADKEKIKETIYEIIMMILKYIAESGIGKYFLEYVKKIIIPKIKGLIMDLVKRTIEKIKKYLSNDVKRDRLITGCWLFWMSSTINYIMGGTLEMIMADKYGVDNFSNVKKISKGYLVGNIVINGIINPLNNEIAKMLSVRTGCEKEYMIISTFFESKDFILNNAKQYKVSKLVLARTLTNAMNMINEYIHSKLQDPKVKKVLHLSDDAAMKLEMVITTLIHSLWNITNIFNVNPMDKIVANGKK